MLHRFVRGLTVLTCLLTFALIAFYSAPGPLHAARTEPLPQAQLEQQVHLPDGFHIQVYALGLAGARIMRFTGRGDLLVSSPQQGRVFLLHNDADRDGSPDGIDVLLSKLNNPHGLALFDGWLYVAEATAVFRIRFDGQNRAVLGAPEYVLRDIPTGGHWTRSVAIGPDHKLYVSIGSSCNVCIEQHPWRATILRSELDGTGATIFASGLRNSVGMAWNPANGEMFATDNGRDWLGDDFPPCELNRIVEGGFYGWPFTNGNRVTDPDQGTGHEAQIETSISPAHSFGAHVAPLGITFYNAKRFPPLYRGAAFVAQHGSWNRLAKSGYAVVALFFGTDGTIREEPFATGFTEYDAVFGRPVDVAVGPDGNLYVSDDTTGAIYRIDYATPEATPR